MTKLTRKNFEDWLRPTASYAIVMITTSAWTRNLKWIETKGWSLVENILNEIWLEIKSLKKGQDELKDDVGVLKVDVASLKDDVIFLKVDVASLKDDVGVLKVDVQDLKRVPNAISEQTATLTEFRTEINQKFDTMIENQKSLFEM